MDNWTTLLIILVYCVIVLAVGLMTRSKGNASLEGYYVGGRSIKPFVAFFTYVATFHSSFAFLGAAGQLYTSGISFFATFTSCVVSPLMIYFIGRPTWYLGKKYNFITQGELLGSYYKSPFLRGLVAVVTLLFLVPYLQSQITAGGLIFSSATGDLINYTWGCILLYAVIIGYILLGGFKAVAWTDTVQGILMIILAWISGGVILGATTGNLDWSYLMNRVATELPSRVMIPIDYWPIYMTSFISLFGVSIFPPSFQRFFAVENPKSLKWLAVSAPVYLIFFYVPIMIVAFCGAIYMPGLERPDQVLPMMLMEYSTPVLAGLVMAGALAATMSSADSQLHSASSIFTMDIYKQFINKNASDKQSLRVGKIAIVVMSALALVLSQFVNDLIVSIVTIALGGCLQVMPSLIGALYWKRGTKAGAIAGLIVGVIVVGITQYIWKTPLGLSSGAWGLIFNSLTFVVVSLFTPAPDADSQERFHGYLAKINANAKMRDDIIAGKAVEEN